MSARTYQIRNLYPTIMDEVIDGDQGDDIDRAMIYFAKENAIAFAEWIKKKELTISVMNKENLETVYKKFYDETNSTE